MSTLVLFYPGAALTYKYVLVGLGFEGVVLGSAIGAILFFMTGLSRLGSRNAFEDDQVGSLFLHTREIMWDFWSQKRVLPLLRDKHDRSRRQGHYFNKSELGVFQQSLTCALPEAKSIVDLLHPEFKKLTEYSLLDVGGGDGLFTSLLIDQLKNAGTEVSQLTMIDPADWEDEYVQKVGPSVLHAPIQVVINTLDEFRSAEKYDIVLASHSLYASLDSRGNDASRVQSEVVHPLLSYVKKGGVLAVTLASKNSASYCFKSSALTLLFGEEVEDATSEVFWRSIQPIRNRLTTRRVDSVINLTNVLTEYRDGDDRNLFSWLNYFLRYKVSGLRKEEKQIIVNRLENSMTQFDQLPQSFIEHLGDRAGIVLVQDTPVITHKSEVFVYQG